MLKRVKLYPAWFTDRMSFNACEQLKLTKIHSHEWLSLADISNYVLPHNFQLFEYAKSDKIDLLYFTPPKKEYADVRIHPEKFFQVVKKELGRKLRDALRKRNSRRYY